MDSIELGVSEVLIGRISSAGVLLELGGAFEELENGLKISDIEFSFSFLMRSSLSRKSWPVSLARVMSPALSVRISPGVLSSSLDDSEIFPVVPSVWMIIAFTLSPILKRSDMLPIRLDDI